MEVNLLWTGLEYYSLENCLVQTGASTGNDIRSTIVGYHGEKIYLVNYHIKTNSYWETLFLDVTCRHTNAHQKYLLETSGDGKWRLNGKIDNRFEGCRDVDIALTPFTNTLPINRLLLADHQEKQIRVIYLDLLQQQVKPVDQQYTRMSPTEYHYQNMPNDFEAVIKVDEFGLVVDYPLLFKRTAVAVSDHPAQTTKKN